jgi:hypothetical protein
MISNLPNPVNPLTRASQYDNLYLQEAKTQRHRLCSSGCLNLIMGNSWNLRSPLGYRDNGVEKIKIASFSPSCKGLRKKLARSFRSNEEAWGNIVRNDNIVRDENIVSDVTPFEPYSKKTCDGYSLLTSPNAPLAPSLLYHTRRFSLQQDKAPGYLQTLSNLKLSRLFFLQKNYSLLITFY